MANKGLWCLVQYPKSTDLEKLLGVLRGSGAAIMWILHDKDKKEDGTPKDPHYHIVAGWSKGFPDWGKVLDMIAQGGYNPPHMIEGQEQKPFKPKVYDCYPKGTPEEIRLYLLHWDESSKKAGKHQYSEEELHTDDKWNPGDYVKAEDKRRSKSAEKAAEKADAFAAALKVAKDKSLGEWADLCDYYAENGLDLGALVSVAYPVKSYLDSRRNLGKTTSAQVRQLLGRIEELHSELKQYKSGKDPIYKELADKLASCHCDLMTAEQRAEEHDKAVNRAICIIQKLYSQSGEYVGYTDVMTALYNPERSAIYDALEIHYGESRHEKE